MNHHPCLRSLFPAGRTMTAAILLAGAAIALAPADPAATRALTSGGALYTIAAEPRSLEAGTSGTKIVVRGQSADGATQAWVLPGTDDAVVDIEPALAVCPSSGLPVAAWSRQEAGGYQIEFASFDGVRWSAPRALTADSLGHRGPQAVCGTLGGVHLMWTAGSAPDGSPLFYEAALEPKGTVLVPARLVRAAVGADLTASDGAPPVFTSSDLLFAFAMDTKNGPLVVAFGGQDEPIPIDRRVNVDTQTDALSVQNARIVIVADKVALLFRRAGRLNYSVQSAEGWTPLRTLSLDTMSEEQAELLIRNMASSLPTP